MESPEIELRDALLDPESYPWRPPSVERIETHVSRVFLAGDRVVKIKRPVNLGFIDLRRAAARRAACEAEATLNLRLTEGVYLGTAPIVRRGGGVTVGGAGTPIETAVVMRRLPESSMLSHLIGQGAVPPDAARRIAARLIAFYRAAPRCGPADPAACAEAQLRVVRENVEQIASLPRIAGCGILQAAIARSVDEGAAVLEPRMRLRCADGWVRDGHGDLRAEHICLEPGLPPQMFDCLEFDPGLRCADVASDLAFLVMDLRRRGAGPLADAILADCRDGGLTLPDALLRFSTAHRALVRVKVGIIEQVEGLMGESEVETAGCLDEAAAASLELRPVLAVVSGLSGSGKSEVARRIGRAFGVATLGSDEIRSELFPDRNLSRRYQPENVALVYGELRRRAEALLDAGKPALLDATFLSTGERRLAAVVAHDHGAPFLIVEVRASESTALRRIRERGAHGEPLSDADADVHRRQRERLLRFPPAVPDGAILVSIDNDGDIPPPLDAVTAALETAGVLRSAFASSRDATGG